MLCDGADDDTSRARALAVTARRAFRRVNFEAGLIRLLPAVSALVVLGLGIAMTARALPKVT